MDKTTPQINVWVGIDLKSLNNVNYCGFPPNLPPIPPAHPWQMYKTINDLINMPNIFSDSLCGSRVFIDPKLNIFFKTEDDSIAWCIDENGCIYLYNAKADQNDVNDRDYVAATLADFLFRTAIEHELYNHFKYMAESIIDTINDTPPENTNDTPREDENDTPPENINDTPPENTNDTPPENTNYTPQCEEENTNDTPQRDDEKDFELGLAELIIKKYCEYAKKSENAGNNDSEDADNSDDESPDNSGRDDDEEDIDEEIVELSQYALNYIYSHPFYSDIRHIEEKISHWLIFQDLHNRIK
jgi:hypothetical protein